MDHLTVLDAGFLHAEDSDPNISLAIGGISVLEGPPPDFDVLVDTLTERLAQVPRLRQVLHTHRLDMGAPVLEDRPELDLRHQIKHAAVPAPGDDADLFRLAASIVERRLDRRHPLWECWVIEGLRDDRWALLMKVHHCLADGVSTARMLTDLSDNGSGATTFEIGATHERRVDPAPRITLNPLVWGRAAWNLSAAAVGTGAQAVKGTVEVLSGLLSPGGNTSLLGPVALNVFAPDEGNMHLLEEVATPAQKERWLRPLAAAQIRSCFCMTEPAPGAGSDPSMLATTAEPDGDDYVINGRKWFITNAAHPDCKLLIVMGKTDPTAESHQQQSMVLVPRDTPGVDIVRNINIMNHFSPDGHCEVVFRNVRVPVSNLLGEEGSGFALAQARLGPGRIHHCMRSIGAAELALELMIDRAQERKTFGKYLHQHGTVGEWIAKSRIEIDQARLLVLKAAWMIDNVGAKEARKEISMIKALVPGVHTSGKPMSGEYCGSVMWPS